MILSLMNFVFKFQKGSSECTCFDSLILSIFGQKGNKSKKEYKDVCELV